MGQKVHPLGFRVGITKKHQSQWFARFHKHKYAQTVLEDRMLRETLTKLFPQLLNPVLKKKRDSQDELSVVPKITQIKIERGLIPYEIAIQIHAENCDLIKSSIENLKVNRDLLCQLQKTRRYLQHLRLKLNNLSVASSFASEGKPASNAISASTLNIAESRFASEEKGKAPGKTGKSSDGNGRTAQGYFAPFGKTYLTKQQLSHQRLILKRLRKRQSIRRRYKQFVAKGLFLTKKGSLLKIVLRSPKRGFSTLRAGLKNKDNFSNLAFSSKKDSSLFQSTPKVGMKETKNLLVAVGTRSQQGSANIFQSRIKKKFVSIFINRMNHKFLQALKSLLRTFVPLQSTSVQEGSVINQVQFSLHEGKSSNPRSVNVLKNRLNAGNKENFKKGSIARREGNVPSSVTKGLSYVGNISKTRKALRTTNSLLVSSQQYKSLSQLNKFIIILEQKALKKMETLRKNFMTFASIPKTEAYNYYKMLTFLKQTKELVSQMKRKHKISLLGFSRLRTAMPSNEPQKLGQHSSASERLSQSSNKLIQATPYSSGRLATASSSTSETFLRDSLSESTNKTLTGVKMNLLSKKLNNIDNECRKIKFIEYLKQIVKKHRTNNIYLYLSTIADARKDLRKLQQFTKRNASFLFGLNSVSNINNVNSLPSISGESSVPSEQGVALASPTFPTLQAGDRQSEFAGRISNVLQKINMKSLRLTSSSGLAPNVNTIDPNKTLSEVFLEQIEKQRHMFKHNIQLTPKIAIKFYSVNSKTVKAKASVVADSIVDALEKRKAFRKVIKDAKEELMRTPGVKGVKIQVAGRLNGAEIARSEWVRAGRVPLQTLRANLDYCYKTASTIYGIIGIKVWIFKGYTKLL